MPQGRIILKAICQSRKVAGLKTHGARLLYTWLIINLDIDGLYSGEADVIKGQVFTRLKDTSRAVESYLQDLDDAGLIVRYSSNGDQFLCVPDFADKQPSLNPTKEARSTIPPPTPEQLQSKSGETPRKVKESKVKESKKEKAIVFDIFRKLYPGKKRGLDPEFENFTKKYESWLLILPLLKPAIENQVAERAKAKCAGEFVPAWKHLKTWINNQCWTEEPAQGTSTATKAAREKRQHEKNVRTALEQYKCFAEWPLEKVQEYIKKKPGRYIIMAAKHYKPAIEMTGEDRRGKK